jgi:hypothetical protein
MKKTYSFYIKMSTRIQRLSFEMLHSEAESKNEEYRKKLATTLLSRRNNLPL